MCFSFSETHHSCSSRLEPLKTSVDVAVLHHWDTVNLLLPLLRGQLHCARDNLLAASVQNPLYGVMQSVRTILEEMKAMCVFVVTYTHAYVHNYSTNVHVHVRACIIVYMYINMYKV